MGFEISEEKLEIRDSADQERGEAEQTRPDFASENQEIHESKSRIQRIKQLMKEFTATGLVLFAVGGAAEVGRRATVDKPEGQRVQLEEIQDIEYGNGVLKSEDIRAFFDALPANWVEGEVSYIRNTDMDKKTGGGNLTVLATRGHISEGIDFNRQFAKNFSRFTIVQTLAHEVAHANDFFTDNELTGSEKDELLMKIKDRLDAGNRYRSVYLESIEEDAGGAVKLREYWAEICAAYMMDPTALDVEDFKLVDEYVKKNDPGYNWKESIQKRWDIAYAK